MFAHLTPPHLCKAANTLHDERLQLQELKANHKNYYHENILYKVSITTDVCITKLKPFIAGIYWQ